MINRDNPLIIHFKKLAETNPSEAINQIFLLIESSVPTKTIFINEAKDEDKHDTNKMLDDTTIRQTAKALYESFIDQDKSPLQAKALLKIIEPFNYYEDLIDLL